MEAKDPLDYNDALAKLGQISEAEAVELLLVSVGRAIGELDRVEPANRTSSTLLREIAQNVEEILGTHAKLQGVILPQQTEFRVRRLHEILQTQIAYWHNRST